MFTIMGAQSLMQYNLYDIHVGFLAVEKMGRIEEPRDY